MLSLDLIPYKAGRRIYKGLDLNFQLFFEFKPQILQNGQNPIIIYDKRWQLKK